MHGHPGDMLSHVARQLRVGSIDILATDRDRLRQDGADLRALQVGDGIATLAGSWTFGGDVPDAFDSHVARSVPAYAEGQELVADLADQLVPAGGRCYDLGCSTGALTALLAERLAPRRVDVIGVDREPGMIERAAERCSELPQVRFATAALEELELEPADLIVAYYTLQFIPLRERRRIVERIHRALSPSGALVLFEKVLAPTARTQEVGVGAYIDWKRRQGFSDDEIAAKTRSIRGVLEPLSPIENDSMLREAGFREVMPVFRWVLFEGLLARA
jgi:tRNA (cmo5U34)-methyltransferase